MTAKKIKIVGSGYLDVLRQYDDQIPTDLGGSYKEEFRWCAPWPECSGVSDVQMGYAAIPPLPDGEKDTEELTETKNKA